MKQERQKEISSLIQARKISLTNGKDESQVKSEYRKVNPVAEIMMARKLSGTHVGDDAPEVVSSPINFSRYVDFYLAGFT
ncbi:unnamed protein product [Protopolystoma xenopodis]|uniref:Uncharacterized protein n=1 Tax=Protopolystoma xenopodis TaxID=117903 RepID=A0A448X380_9PLAT|nr:unnamed protein product [Protopolystoma xenopodis]